jgi:glutamate racemase
MIFALDLRPKIIPPAPFSLSNPDDPAFNNSLLEGIKQTAVCFPFKETDISATQKIGIFDSGLGGLSVLREIIRELPGERIIYCADTRHMPFGPRPIGEVREYVFEASARLSREPVKILILACNTASAAALRELRRKYPGFPIVGMEPAVKPAAAASKSGRIGVLATQATFQGELFESVVSRFAEGVEVIRQPCPGLAEFIENHPLNHPVLEAMLEKYLRPLLERGVDEIVLACTHYSLVKKTIGKMAGPLVNLVDPCPAIARRTRDILYERELLNYSSQGGIEFWVTGEEERFSRLASDILRREVKAKRMTFSAKDS